jgi:hypothetical protein
MAIDQRLADIALEYVEGSAFELFFRAFGAEMFGVNFVPLGGTHDGGADGFEADRIYEGRATHFYQASTEQIYAGKIRRTVKRLRAFGRDVRVLTYISSRDIPNSDQEEESLSDELDVTIRIRSRKWIASNIDRSAATQAAFEAHLRPFTVFLSDVGGARLLDRSPLPGSAACHLSVYQDTPEWREREA